LEKRVFKWIDGFDSVFRGLWHGFSLLEMFDINVPFKLSGDASLCDGSLGERCSCFGRDDTRNRVGYLWYLFNDFRNHHRHDL
jgi:hypothetical protein